ncbi:uncharacterized protein LOC133524399 isoform X2 [Cydia pomonella]|uniref:uncharacterized protein LOC133524399 isoform X2 n=1 Tax=Cydia pomonella TaxID=82600 RepID=UPI002ADD4326|nr:uncharacterized protein LOC133524399 isoform X2 [Cydia pomonella]
MKVAVIFIIVAPGLSLQHRHSDSGSSEIDDSRQSQEYDSEQSPYSYRTDKRKQKTRYEVQPGSAELESSNKKYIKHSSKHSRRRSKKHTKDENCDSNEGDQPETNHAEQSGLGPGNLVFVPYPYPLVVPPPVPVVPDPTTTLTVSTTSTAPSIIPDTRTLNNQKITEIADKESYWDLLRTLKRRQELPYGRNDARPMRRFLLDRLLSHVRNVKDINSV